MDVSLLDHEKQMLIIMKRHLLEEYIATLTVNVFPFTHCGKSINRIFALNQS